MRGFFLLCALVVAAWPCTAAPPVQYAQLQAFNAELLSHDSATATLQHWCADHRLAAEPRIVATALRTAPRPPSAQQRASLEVTTSEPVNYRHVQLRCGEVVMSEAENWYVPARLTPAMNHELETTDAPFGAVVRPLQFHRRTLQSRLLWLPEQPQVPAAVLEHHALLVLPDGTPFSLLVETYSGSVLSATQPPAH
jgi:chorismate-pyruvate lyase